MRAIHTVRSLVAIGTLAITLVSIPTTAHAAVTLSVPCSEIALVNAVTTANLSGGGTLTLAPFCTYSLTSPHGSGSAGPAGLPNITTPITMTGFITDITRAPGAGPFRIFEVDGPTQVTGANGQLSLARITVRGGDAGIGSGGGIVNLGGTVTLDVSTVRNNNAAFGGGVYTNANSSLTLNSSTVTDNTASVDGGGIFKEFGSTVALSIGTLVISNTPDNCANPVGPTSC